MRCFGHRGAKGHILENTLESFDAALALGLEWVEFDVQLVGDELFVFHDATLERLAGIKKSLGDCSSEEIRAVRLQGGYRIPSLDETLDHLKGRLKCNIELKGISGTQKLYDSVMKHLGRGWKNEDLCISSFNLQALAELADKQNSLWLGLLYYGLPVNLAADVSKIGSRSVHVSLEYADLKIINAIHSCSNKAYVYTVNDPVDIARMRALGVDGVFSDYPERVLDS